MFLDRGALGGWHEGACIPGYKQQIILFNLIQERGA